MNRTRRGVAATVALLTLGAGGATAAQAASGTMHHTSHWLATRSKPLTALKGATRVGAVKPSTRLSIDVALTPRHAAAEKSALKAMYTPGSSSYRHFLKPAQWRSRYAPTKSSTTKVTNYLHSNGFSHVVVAKNRLLVTGSGSVADAAKAFHTSFANYRIGAQTFRTNTSTAAVPESLAGLVTSVVGLSDLPFATPHPVKQSSHPAAAGSPNIPGSLSPKQFQVTYDATGTTTGSKTKIAIFSEGDQTQVLKDLRLAESKNGLPEVPVTEIKLGPQSTDTSGADEFSMDTQVSSAMAQTLKRLYLYNVGSLVDSQVLLAFDRFVSDDKASAMSASIGGCDIGPYLDGTMVASDVVLQEGAMQGQSLFASSGDNGEGCAYVAATGAPSSFPGTNWPASGEFTTAVGGTSLITDSDGNRVVEPAWVGSGGGISEVENPGWWEQDSDVGFDAQYASGGRAVPDISLDADPNSTAAEIYVNGQIEYVGGTSLSSPLMAGVWARLESAHSNNLGLASIDIYQLYDKVNPSLGSTSAVPGFTDVTVGTNGLWAATPGYDEVTGVGTPDVKALMSAL